MKRKKEADRCNKQARETALQEICRQSLESDRKGVGQQRAQNESPGRHNDMSPPSTPISDGLLNPSRRSNRVRPAIARSAALPKSPMRELQVEDEDGSSYAETNSTLTDVDSLPWHHAQLYRLYGESADYFIHPKIEPKASKPVLPKLKRTEGHVGAEKLWDTLRSESKLRLLREDARFPCELKEAYSAFVRQSLTMHKMPVTRNYCATEDVPEIDRLMDQSLLHKIRTLRHRTELMYRSSRANNDRTKILIFNNPLPNLNEGGEDDTIGRYLPSWIDDASEITQPEYRKWITLKQNDIPEENEGEQGNKTKEHVETRDILETELMNKPKAVHDEIIPLPSRSAPRVKPQYEFLTEKDTKCRGQFSQRFQEKREKKDHLAEHRHLSCIKPQSALGFSEARNTTGPLSGTERSQSVASRYDMLQRFTSGWEPLSMPALVEYKKHCRTRGEGDFQHGRMKMWPVVI